MHSTATALSNNRNSLYATILCITGAGGGARGFAILGGGAMICDSGGGAMIWHFGGCGCSPSFDLGQENFGVGR